MQAARDLHAEGDDDVDHVLSDDGIGLFEALHTELQGDMAECKDQLNTMDVEVAKMANKCEVRNLILYPCML